LARALASLSALARMKPDRHWANQRERGNFALMRLTAMASRCLGRRALSPLLYLIVGYFFIFGRRARMSVRQYQNNLANWSERPHWRACQTSVFAQFMAFAESLLDKLDVWHGRLTFRDIELIDPDDLHSQMNRQGAPGQMLVGAHLGNLEVCRALAEQGKQVRMNVLVHTRHAEQFNRLLKDSGASHLRLIQVSELDPAGMLRLANCLERGEWLAIAGDRIPLHGERTAEVRFLGCPAQLPQGPWLLAGLLRCPVNLLDCMKIDGRYRIMLKTFTKQVNWKRNERDQVIQALAQRYADHLARRCLLAPLQWFNFYPFWKQDDNNGPT
jgi:predicted LPLAT superfamily acyltransferase